MKGTANGISTFFYFAIPAVLALAAIWWLAFGQGLHYFNRELDQERRHAEIVGAKILPREPIKIEVRKRRNGSLVIDRAEIDGSKAWVYLHNAGSDDLNYSRLSWRILSPDGTIIGSEWNFIDLLGGPEIFHSGDKAELSFSVHADPRAEKLIIEVSE